VLCQRGGKKVNRGFSGNMVAAWVNRDDRPLKVAKLSEKRAVVAHEWPLGRNQ
jgi:hypothetical protein